MTGLGAVYLLVGLALAEGIMMLRPLEATAYAIVVLGWPVLALSVLIVWILQR